MADRSVDSRTRFFATSFLATNLTEPVTMIRSASQLNEWTNTNLLWLALDHAIQAVLEAEAGFA